MEGKDKAVLLSAIKKDHGTEEVTNHFVQPGYLQEATGYLFPVISIIYLEPQRLEPNYSLISNQYTPYS